MTDLSTDQGLQAALAKGLAPGGNLGEALTSLGEFGVARPEDARALSSGLKEWLKAAPKGGIDLILPLHLFTGLLQGVETREAYEILRREALPVLLQGFDQAIEASPVEGVETLLFVLKVAGMFSSEETVDRIAVASAREIGASSRLWPAIFSTFGDDHPYQLQLAQRLKSPLPPGLIGLGYLQFVENLLASNRLTFHPFDTPEGRERLAAWLSETADVDAAMIAAANLPYLEREGRDSLFKLARMHPNGGVRLKGSWAEAKLGDEVALRKLVELCKSPGRGRAAIDALEGLGKGNLVPSVARQPSFLAAAEMCDWLSHPTEYGRPPDAIDVVDTRSANWPPTNDLRRLWLFRFRYVTDGATRQGYGLTGSITFSLRAETEQIQDPIDLYALHCLWELQANDDPRSPRERTVERGREVLKSFGWPV